MVMLAVDEEQPPAIVLVTVYVPGVLAAKLTTPVDGLIDNPAVDTNVPEVPVMVGVAVAPVVQ
jgi:hypothetical protein